MSDYLLSVVCAFLMSAGLTALLIPYLRKKAGQNIREDGPEAHKKKAGTPSMGGIAIIVATVFCALAAGGFDTKVWAIVIVMLLYGLMGFLDDFLKVAHKENLGLKAWQKLVIQIAIGVGVGVYMMKTTGSGVWIPYFDVVVDFGMLYVPFIMFVLVAMSNSVNLTDGLDGLASGTTMIVALFFGAMAAGGAAVYHSVACASFALAGACLGFLTQNKYPAKIFMGDTGSMALGGAVAMIAIVFKTEFILPIVGFVYVMEALSVIIQVVSFKTRGKRVFRMAPIHHHFELGGMHEHKVVLMFDLIAIICCLIGSLAF